MLFGGHDFSFLLLFFFFWGPEAALFSISLFAMAVPDPALGIQVCGFDFGLG